MPQDAMDEIKILIAREIPQMRRFALFLTKNNPGADDLVQDALERAIRKRHLWRRHGNIRSWLYRLMYNLFLNQRQRDNRYSDHINIEDMVTPPSAPAEQFQKVAFHDVAEALDSLPDEHAAPIILTAVEGFSYDETASILDIPIGTLRSRLFRGREALRNLCDVDQIRADGAAEPDPIDRGGIHRSHLRRVK